MEALGGCGQGQEAGPVKEPEHVHIKEKPETRDCQYEDLVKEEAWCVEEVGQEPSSSETAGSCGVSSAAMLAGLYADHTVKEELRAFALFRGWSLADIDRGREQLERILQREGTPSTHSDTEQDVLPRIGETERAEARRSSADGTIGVHIKEKPETRDCQYEDLVKEEARCVDEVGQQPSSSETAGSCGVSSAAMLAGLYADRTVKEELRAFALFRGWSLADIDRGREQLERILQREGTPSTHSDTEQDVLPRIGETERAEARRSSADGTIGVHIKEKPETRDCQYEDLVKEEARCVDEVGQQPSSSETAGSCGVSSAAMLAGLYADRTVKEELRAFALFRGWSLADIDRGREQLERILQREGTPSTHSDTEQDVLPRIGETERAEARRSSADGTIGVHIKKKPETRDCQYEDLVKEEARCVDEVGQQPSSSETAGSCGVSSAAMLAGLYADRTVKEELRAFALFRGWSLADIDRGREQLERILQREGTPSTHSDTEQDVLPRIGETERAEARRSSADGTIGVGAESAVSLRARRQLAAACVVRLERLHTGKKQFKCDFCGYTCSDKSSIRKHKRIHTREKPFECDYCDYKFSQKSNLQTHCRTHTGEKPFKCGICNFKCSQKTNLQTHQRTHTGEKPFKCDFCDYTCSDKSSIRKHKRIHTREKPFECDYCDYKFSQISNLQTHCRTHTGEKPFKCGICNFKCSQKISLQTHQRKHTRKEAV